MVTGDRCNYSETIHKTALLHRDSTKDSFLHYHSQCIKTNIEVFIYSADNITIKYTKD